MLEKGMQKTWRMLQNGSKMGAEINTNPLKNAVQKCVDFWDQFMATPSADFAGEMVSDQENIQQETQQKRKPTGRELPGQSSNPNTPAARGESPRPGADFWV